MFELFVAVAVTLAVSACAVVATLKFNSWTLRKGGCYGEIHKNKSSA